MRTLLAAVAASILLAACQSRNSAPALPNPRGNFKYGTGDGLTMATAVEIRAHSEIEGGILVRDWIMARYPGFTIQEQSLIEQRGRAYNLITITSPSNAARSVYFDISSYYRRIGNENFPKPPT